MADNLENNINHVLNIVEEYTSYNYLNKISIKGLKEHLLKLATGVNNLGDSITGMLIENKCNGLTIDDSFDMLLINVDKLNQNSNEVASSFQLAKLIVSDTNKKQFKGKDSVDAKEINIGGEIYKPNRNQINKAIIQDKKNNETDWENF